MSAPTTETGDAWVLDPLDGLALCLAIDGCERPWRVHETGSQFSVEWTAKYRFDGTVMTVVENSGRSRSIVGYPLDEIRRAVEKTRA